MWVKEYIFLINKHFVYIYSCLNTVINTHKLFLGVYIRRHGRRFVTDSIRKYIFDMPININVSQWEVDKLWMQCPIQGPQKYVDVLKSPLFLWKRISRERERTLFLWFYVPLDAYYWPLSHAAPISVIFQSFFFYIKRFLAHFSLITCYSGNLIS